MKRTCEWCGHELPEHLMRMVPRSLIFPAPISGNEPWECRSLERCIVRTRAKRRDQVHIADEKERVE